MKKLLALLLALLMVFALAACSGSDSDSKKDDGGSNSDEPDEPEVLYIKDDTTLPGMTFTPPEGYIAVERTFDAPADGSTPEKNLKFYYDEDTTLNFAYSDKTGANLSEMLDLDTLESVDCDGVTFYFYEQSGESTALAQIDNVIYGVDYVYTDKDRTRLDDALKSIKFEETEPVMENEDPDQLGDITYALDDNLNVVSTYSTQKETTDGELMEKSMTWRFGEDKDNVDFRFLIRLTKNAKLEDVLNSETTYVDEKVGDIDYKVRKDDDGASLEYITQHGDDVYEIKNLGVYTGWSTRRTDESKTAFSAFFTTISFQ